MNKQEKANNIASILDELYPTTPIPLEHEDPYTLLVAVLFEGDFILLYHHIIKYCKHKLGWNFHSKFFEGAH